MSAKLNTNQELVEAMQDPASMCQAAPLCITQWHWAGSHGRWHSFDAETRHRLETAYQEWLQGYLAQGELRLQVGEFTYQIDFEAKVQMNTLSNKQRSISRELASVRWLWCDGKGRHHEFDANSSVWLEEKYQAWEAHGIHNEDLLNVGDHSYEIDFASMTQRNSVSGRERSINRALESCPGQSASCTVCGTSCVVCGCSADFDLWGDRVCWCDNCWSTGCSTSPTSWAKRSSLKKAMVAPRENLGHEVMQVAKETAAGERHFASCCQVHACDEARSTGQRHVTVKASFGNDVRRLPTTWPVDASHAEMYAAICLAVQRGFSSLFKTGPTFDLKYVDDDEDMCSLVVETMDDWLSFGSDGILRLVMVQQLNASMASPVASPRTQSGEPGSNNEIGEEYDVAWSLIEPPEALCKTFV